MANCMILFPNRADAPKGALPGASVTGPASALPLANMQDRRSSKVWRSIDRDPANTRFDVRLNRQNQIKALVLVRHNLTVTSRWRVTAWYDDQSPDPAAPNATPFIYEQDVYASVGFTEDLDWEAENWWDGKPLSEDLEGFAQNAILVLPEFVSAPNWRVEIFDPTNPAGYVQVARLFMAGGWTPPQNYAYGGAHRYETTTAVETALSGAEFFDRREPFRVATIGFEYMEEGEALLKGLELSRRAGVDGEVFWIADPADPRRLTQTSFLARLRQLSSWEQVVFQRANIAFELKELL